jgi:hypothetical protein
MMIEMYTLPVNDLHAIDVTAMELTSAKRNGVDLSPEQEDWLDFANNVVLIHSQIQ